MMEDILENMTTIDDDDKNDHAWGVPIRDDNLTNLSDEEYLSTILGPRRMGYQVFFLLQVFKSHVQVLLLYTLIYILTLSSLKLDFTS